MTSLNAAVTGSRRGRRDVAAARLIDPLTGPRSPGLSQDEATPIYDVLIAELGVPGLLVGPGRLVAGETVPFGVPVEPMPTGLADRLRVEVGPDADGVVAAAELLYPVVCREAVAMAAALTAAIEEVA